MANEAGSMQISVVFGALFLAYLTCVYGGVLTGGSGDEPDAHGYLQRFGYLQRPNPETGNMISEEHYTQAIKTFQTFANLPITGVLDAETKRMMDAPRCGVPDITEHEKPTPNGQTHRRKKRFVLQGSKWRVKDLTWSITQPTNQLTRNEVETQLARAWKIWSDNSALTFTKASGGNVHIDVRFAKYEHGDGDPFDGPGKTLAHAYFPQYGGDAHFDDSEPWTTGRYGTNLYQVAAHEFGHSLGLSHSNVKSSLMAPFYRGYDDNLHLDPDDIAAIQEIYGGPPSGSRSGTTDYSGWNPFSASSTAAAGKPSRGQSPSLPVGGRKPVIPTIPSDSSSSAAAVCKSPVIDAITNTADGITYAFKDDLYYQLNDYGVEPGHSRRISTDWKGLFGPLDAALTWSDGKTFFFKGNKYWRFLNKKPLPGYPKLISKGFAGIPDNIDAAFTWSGNGKTYFIKGSQYWLYDSAAQVPVSSEYPKPLSVWQGLPNHIDAAFQWKNGKTFFFSGNQYYRFNDKKFSVESDYPRPNGVWWFGCGHDSTKDFVDSSANAVQVEAVPQADSGDFSGSLNDAVATVAAAIDSEENIITLVRDDQVYETVQVVSGTNDFPVVSNDVRYLSSQYSNSDGNLSTNWWMFGLLTVALFLLKC